ncbi:MAG: acetyl-CoA carboxylase carboxyltransferase subunit beta [Candidatus Omnitrophica bacterium]|nr:acetyl-CoA carboxylase carboxyltransferase subunit beta [Candidatus Omnitrophota bacterium]
MPLFGKPADPRSERPRKRGIPAGLWTKCPDCERAIFNKHLADNLMVCPRCSYHFTLGASERINLLLDSGSFKEREPNLESVDFLSFKGPKTYTEKIAEDRKITGLKEACVTGTGRMDGVTVAFGVTDSRFIMGSMGSVVGEKLTRLVEHAHEERLPVVIVSGSGGGARMYESVLSLMQMAKTSTAIARYQKAGRPYISVLTNPTMAGVMASYASLGDLVIAEPKALLGFTGPRVIEQTIRQKLPPGFQRSEFLLEHGLIDMVVARRDLKKTISQLLHYLMNGQAPAKSPSATAGQARIAGSKGRA